MRRRTIEVGALARVEGEGALRIRLRGDRVEQVELRIFEPPRFFEAFLRGRDFREVPDVTARICGICPVAYQMSSAHALERACGVRVDGPLRALRRLLYCGEWIESHVLHVYLLHAPDFLGYPGALEMARDHPERVQQALRLKKLGNEIVALVGGREIHPVNVRVGGFYRAPAAADLRALAERLRPARDAAVEMVRFAASLPMPDCERDYDFVALRHPDEYPMNEGRVVSSQGLDIDVAGWEDGFHEEQVAHSHALHATRRGRGPYLVGPLARYALNFDRLPPGIQALAAEVGLGPVCRNPFQSIVVRSLETLYAVEEALRVLEQGAPPGPGAEVEPRAGVGHAATEAPRGLLYHRYRIDEAGRVLEARIVPPTSQNQKTIEDDLRRLVALHVDLPDERLQALCEQAIRNHDPCISCATHFLKLTVERA